MTDWLSVTERGAAQPVVTRYVGGFTRTVLSAGFGTTVGADGVSAQSQINTAFQTDDDTLYAVLFNGLYQSTDSGATFSSVLTFTSPATTTDNRLGHGGIHFVYNAGTQETFLAGFFKNSSNSLIGWSYRLSDGAGVQTTGPSVGAGPIVLGSEMLYGTMIHLTFGTATTQTPYSFDPVSASWATYAFPSLTVTSVVCHAVAEDGVLYLLALESTTPRFVLFRFTGAWSLSAVIEATPGALTTEGRCVLFSDGTNLISFNLFLSGASAGWRARQIPSPFDGTGIVNLTATIVPSELRQSTIDGGTASSTTSKRCFPIQDTEATPGTLATFLAFSEDSAAGTAFSVREYQGLATPITFVGTGGQVRDSLPQGSRNGGGYFYTPGQDGVRITSVTAVSGGESIEFIASGGGTVDVQFRYAHDQQAAITIATLIGSATGGGTRVGNQVQGVTADGVTLNTITWDFPTDGFANSEGLAVLVPEVV
jgi:hypothetical protein